MGSTRSHGPRRGLLASWVAVAMLTTLVAGCGSPATATFAVSELTVESTGADIGPGDAVVVTARVQNTGTAAGTYAADLTVDGSITAQDDVDLPAGQSEIVRFRISAGAPGDYDVRLGEAVANLHVTDVARASFVVSGLAIEPSGAEIQPGDEVTVSATVRNAGRAAGTFDASLTVDGSVEGQDALELAAGESRDVRFALVAGEAGDHALRLGDATATLRVLGPASFELTSLVVDPNPAETGDRLRVVVGVTNEGGLAGTHAVRLSIDGRTTATKEATLAGGEQTTVAFSVKSPAAGRHTVAAGDLETQLVVWRIERPANGKVLVNKLKGGMGRLTIDNDGDRDGYVVLAKTAAPRRTLLAVYVRAGRSATVRGIRDGNYIVYFRLGKRWDAHSRSFTVEQEARRFENPVRFKTTRISGGTRYTIWTISLVAVVGGNAPTDFIDEGQFPGG